HCTAVYVTLPNHAACVDYPSALHATTRAIHTPAPATVAPSTLSYSTLFRSRTTSSPPQTIRAFVLNSACQFCFNDVLTSPLTVTSDTHTARPDSPDHLVTGLPTQVTIPASGNNTDADQHTTLSTPSATIHYV